MRRKLFPLLLLFALTGCHSTPPGNVAVDTGVNFERDAGAGVQVLSVDLRTAAIQPVIVAEDLTRLRNNVVGDSKTVQEWADKYKAIGGMNAGYFGDTYDQVGRRKQVVGLATIDSKVAAPWGVVTSTGAKPERYIRSALGFSATGTPSIVWATGSRRGGMKQYESPLNPLIAEDWTQRFAVGCGPHLWAGGTQRITDHEERLISPGKLARAFVAYDTDEQGPHHFVLCRADAMEFTDAARWLGTYFKQRFGTVPQEAMCMDGGPSAQLVYRAEGRVQDAEATGVLVPTAILLLPRKP